MPTAKQAQDHFQGQLLALMGGAGTSKSTFAMQSPQPHAILAVDKPVIAPLPDNFPGYNPEQSFGKFYPPPERDLTDAKALPPRIVFDQLLADLQALKVALHMGATEFTMGGEVWPLPATIIIEGMDFVRDHAVNWVLHTQGKHNMDEFLTADGRPNVFLGWGLVAAKMDEFFQNLVFLPSVRPVNVVITIGLDEESKRTAINGKMEMVKTGIMDPAFGGKMALEAPRKFRDCWLTQKIANKYWMVVEQGLKYANYRGLRSGRFWPQGLVKEGLIDVTLDPAKPVNQWQRLFGSNTNP